MNTQPFPRLELILPPWLERVNRQLAGRSYATVQRRARLVIGLSRRNIAEGGGPFAAAVFDLADGRLISAATNLVQPARCSLAHAEMVALWLAQCRIRSHTLAHAGHYQLVSSCQPCAMCMGAIPWSGVRSLVCCAADTDARAIGFDEGAKPDHWIDQYRQRGIEVIPDILRPQARAVLQLYRAAGGPIY